MHPNIKNSEEIFEEHYECHFWIEEHSGPFQKASKQQNLNGIFQMWEGGPPKGLFSN